MNQAEHQLYLDGCEKAFLLFVARNPAYDQSEESAKRMAAELRALGLSPLNPEHLEIAWEKIRTAPAPAPAMDDVEREARALIDSGRISLESINAMSNSLYELNSRSAVFCKALEILEPRREPSVLTTGDLVAANGRANLENSQGKSTTTAEEIEKMEIWRRDHFAKISTAASPAPGASSGVVNLHQAMHIPKLATEAQLAAAIRRDKEDQKFLEEVALKMNQARRVKANRARR